MTGHMARLRGESTRTWRRIVVAGGLVVALGATTPGIAVAATPHAAPNVPVTPTDFGAGVANNSPMLAVDPTDSRFVVLANRLDAPDYSCAMHMSGDGGRGWVPARPVPVLPAGAEKCYGPEVAFDRSGLLYYLFVGLQGSGNEPMGVFLTTSADRARTFGAPRLVLGPSNYQVRMVIDPGLGKSGRLHLVWLHASGDAPTGGLPTPPNPIMAAHSDDGGRTFSDPVAVSDAERARVVAPAVAIGPDHSVHVAYYDLGDDARDYQGLEGPPWEGRWSVVVAASTDRGGRFGRGAVVDDAVVPPGRVILIYTMPPPALAAGTGGRLYAAWPDARFGDPDILLARSGDGGRSWVPPRRLNDDPVGNGATQSLPRLATSSDGRVDVIFSDRRLDPNNLYYNVYFTSSSDGGKHFTPNLRLTSERSDSRVGQHYPLPSAANMSEPGSRLGLVSRPGVALAAWTDTRNDLGAIPQDLFATEVRLPNTAPSRWPLAAAVLAAVLVVGAGGVIVARRRRTPTSDST